MSKLAGVLADTTGDLEHAIPSTWFSNGIDWVSGDWTITRIFNAIDSGFAPWIHLDRIYLVRSERRPSDLMCLAETQAINDGKEIVYLTTRWQTSEFFAEAYKHIWIDPARFAARGREQANTHAEKIKDALKYLELIMEYQKIADAESQRAAIFKDNEIRYLKQGLLGVGNHPAYRKR